jgi:hypothetical protein
VYLEWHHSTLPLGKDVRHFSCCVQPVTDAMKT